MNRHLVIAIGAAATAVAAAALLRPSPRTPRSPTETAAPDSSQAGRTTWFTDSAKAQALARAERKPMLLNFTGSDWCGWCQKLDREVLATREFGEFASKHLILVKADFPRRKPVPESERINNERLAQELGVEGFPTLILIGADGNRLATLGYVPGGPEAFLKELSRALNPAGTPDWRMGPSASSTPARSQAPRGEG